MTMQSSRNGNGAVGRRIAAYNSSPSGVSSCSGTSSYLKPPHHALKRKRRRPAVSNNSGIPCRPSATVIIIAAGLFVVVLYVSVTLWQFSVLDAQSGVELQLGPNNYLRGFPGHGMGTASGRSTATVTNGTMEISNGQDEVSSWSHPLIHIVNTRFMQEQAQLTKLAKARLVLFEKFCLPTMTRQSVYGFTDFDPSPDAASAATQERSNIEQNRRNDGAGEEQQEDDEDFSDPPFLWIIKVDPNLDASILSELISLVKDRREIILVGSNTNFGVGIKGGGWRGGQAGADILETANAGRLYNGDLDLVRRAHDARSDRIVLETRLDADDGLNSLYLERLQRDALEDLYSGFEVEEDDPQADGSNAAKAEQQQQQQQQQHDLVSTGEFQPGMARWLYWCPMNHVAWDPNPPGENPQTNPNCTAYGTFIPWKSPHSCITAGLTVGASVGLEEEDIPRFPHHTVFERIRIRPKNGAIYTSNNGNRHYRVTDANAEPDTGDCGLFNRTACLRMVDHPRMGALRSRTPTSAGMKGVVTQENNKPKAHVMMEEKAKDPKIRKSMWKVLSHYFAVTEEIATEVNTYVTRHFVDIVEDNLRGQCTYGHSCKVSSKEELQRLLDLATEGKVKGVGTIAVSGKAA